jgi:hypothetical protein
MDTAAVGGAKGVSSRRTRRRCARSRTRTGLLTLEVITSVTALAGGALLALFPDGTLLAADPAVLGGSPFEDWRIPGVSLGLLVGGGFALTAGAVWARTRWARPLSVAAGLGLVLFELVELAWLGFHPLQVVFGVVGVTVVVLATRLPQQRQPDPVHLAAQRADGIRERATTRSETCPCRFRRR